MKDSFITRPDGRREKILSRVRALQQEWRVDELAGMLGVSPLTIRRDLDRMSGEGLLIRTHGGCMAVAGLRNSEYVRKVAANFDEKRAIGRAAAREVGPGSVLLLNDGSTTFHLASCLGECGSITVYTNSIAMIGELGRFPNVRFFLIGGEYHAGMFCVGGGLTGRILECIEADTVFMGTDAIDSKGRCLVHDEDTAETARAMLRHGRRRILLADGTKVRLKASVVYGKVSDFDLWITSAMDESVLRRFRRQTKVSIVKISHGN